MKLNNISRANRAKRNGVDLSKLSGMTSKMVRNKQNTFKTWAETDFGVPSQIDYEISMIYTTATAM